jgi:hypothetical protein
MKKLEPYQFNNYLREDLKNCYWFWFRGRVKRTREDSKLIDNLLREWVGGRFKNGFYNCFGIMSGKWNGQSKAEFEKNKVRVSDIFIKSDGDVEKAKSLSRTQAELIYNQVELINICLVSKEMGHIEIFEVFFHRAYELGSVSKQEYREYRLEKLGI